MIWPFTKREPDNRGPSEASRAVALSLRTEPERWVFTEGFLQHDSGIVIDDEGWIRRPNIVDEPCSNSDYVKAAIDDFVAAVMKLPPKAKREDTAAVLGEKAIGRE